jgi:hypothetical protein
VNAQQRVGGRSKPIGKLRGLRIIGAIIDLPWIPLLGF